MTVNRVFLALSIVSGLSVVGILYENVGYSHGNHHGNHAIHDKQDITEHARLNAGYIRTVEPIFRAQCFDCHSRFTNYPWYYRIPLVHALIESDITEAREHLDMSDGFPFRGHGTSLKNDLDAITEVVKDGSMPPLRYRLMHRGSGLTSAEKNVILDWVVNPSKIK